MHLQITEGIGYSMNNHFANKTIKGELNRPQLEDMEMIKETDRTIIWLRLDGSIT